MKFIPSLLLSILLNGIVLVITSEISYWEECAYYVDGACYHYGQIVAPPPAPETPPAPEWQLAKEETKFHATRDSIAKIKNFVVNLNASIKTVRGHNVSIGLNRNDPVWNEFEQMAANGGWEGQPEWNTALTKVKEEIKRVYAMDWTPNNANKRQGADNWAYALFLLRALLEFIKDILNKAKGNAQFHYIFCMANVVPAGAYNPACLDDPIAKNAENIGFIDQWFTNYNRAPATAKTHYADYNTRILDHFNVVIVPTGPFAHPFMGHPFVAMGGMAPNPNGGAYAAFHYYRIPAPAPAPAPAAPAIVLDKQNVSIELSPETKTDIENFIKNFNKKLPMSGNNANKTLYYNNDIFYSFLKKINSQWVGQKTINTAFHRIREFINIAYGLRQEKRGNLMKRKWQENWTFDMFMLRTLFELFKAIIGAAQPQMGTLAQMNNENIAKIDEWFTQLAANSSLLRPEALQIFQKGQQNWADFKTKIDNVFVATVTIPAAPAAAPAPSAPPMPAAGGYYSYQHAYYPPNPHGGNGFMHPHPATWMIGMGMA